MPHIHTEPGGHDSTASAYIVRVDTPEPTLVLHRHRKLGAWLQFGGHVEKNENPWQAIAHELTEESGYELRQLSVLQPPHRIMAMAGVALHPIPLAPMTHKFPGMDHYHSDWGFGFVASEAPANSPNEGESGTIECFTLAELNQLADNEIPQNVKDIGQFILTDALTYWVQVPAEHWTTDTPHPHFE